MEKFKLGMVVETNGVRALREEDRNFEDFVRVSFQRYVKGDWGDLCEEDKHSNDLSVDNGDDMILGKYNYNEEVSIYILTEWDRSYTTILFPSEY